MDDKVKNLLKDLLKEIVFENLDSNENNENNENVELEISEIDSENIKQNAKSG
ncbi:MAG: hypothetical protein KatS3mg068_1546 [Candidatus Sericytochromatia bacterium]|nr:MAG: hypothetical protein KatS3mg068_1546 [Candidatus Sericytochromatia bacterium]